MASNIGAHTALKATLDLEEELQIKDSASTDTASGNTAATKDMLIAPSWFKKKGKILFANYELNIKNPYKIWSDC